MRPRLISDDVLLDAALLAFAELGYEGASIRALCRHLEISHNTLNQRFGSKDRLWRVAVDRGFSRLLAELGETTTDHETDSLQQLRTTTLRLLATARAHPGLIQIVNQESVHPGARYRYLFDNYVGPINELGLGPLRELQAQGRVRPGPVPGIFYYLVTVGLGLMCSQPDAFDTHGDGESGLEEAAVLAVDVVLDGLRVPG